MAEVVFVYRCSSGADPNCEEFFIKEDETKDGQVVLDESGHATCWKCGAELEFVEKR